MQKVLFIQILCYRAQHFQHNCAVLSYIFHLCQFFNGSVYNCIHRAEGIQQAVSHGVGISPGEHKKQYQFHYFMLGKAAKLGVFQKPAPHSFPMPRMDTFILIVRHFSASLFISSG